MRIRRPRKSHEPRFVVRSVTGYPISQNATGQVNGKPPTTIWSVHDSALCYRLVKPTNAGSYGTGGESRARQLARQLNAEHRAYLEEIR